MLILPPKGTLEEQIEYLLSVNTNVFVYYMNTDMIEYIYELIENKDVFILLFGPNSGQICERNVVSIGITIPNIYTFYSQIDPQSSFYIINSNTKY